nr:hypothetical protein [Citrobacter portucalensis]
MEGGLNSYTYPLNPIRKIDPLGFNHGIVLIWGTQLPIAHPLVCGWLKIERLQIK